MWTIAGYLSFKGKIYLGLYSVAKKHIYTMTCSLYPELIVQQNL